ncbi:MAG: DUF2130 domain-containing protein [Deltaproteobacteria bacterium]|nr:DUF2130 domain-containing protein [Deltaproteobacteria bacterium]
MAKESVIITCPYCKAEIRLDEALTDHLRKEFENEMAERVEKVRGELLEREEKIKKLEKALEEERIAKYEEIEKVKKSFKEDFYKRLKEEREKVESEVKKKMEENFAIELKALKEELSEKTRKIKEFMEMEIALRQEKVRLEEEKEQIKLEVTRRLDEERAKIKDELSKKLEEEFKLNVAEKERQIETLRKEIEELRKKAERTGPDSGETLEWVLEEILKENFKEDIIEPVPRGIRGADVIQKVRNIRGEVVGTILWEAKKVTRWNEEYVDKLKEDQREIKAEIAAIVSTTLPKGINGIGCIKGVWIADYRLTVGLASALRFGLLEVFNAKIALEGKKEKLEMLYEYLSGPEFKQQIEGIMEAFVALRNDLEAEKRAMEKIWAKREKQIDKVIKNTTRMYGSLQGIIGSSMPELKSFDLKALPED